MSLLGGIADAIFGSGDGSAEETARQNKALFDAINLPELSWKDYAPEAYNAELSDYELIQENPEYANRQLAALEQMSGLADSGFTESDKAGIESALGGAAQQARGQREAVMQNAQARGVAGGGLEFALKEMANQQANEQARKSGLDVASEGARNRAMAQQAYMSALGNVRGQDFNSQAANTGIINQFNSSNVDRLNQSRQMNTGNRNNAQMYNQEGRQGTAQSNYNNQMRRAEGMAGINNQLQGARDSEAAARQGRVGNLLGAGIGIGTMFTGK